MEAAGGGREGPGCGCKGIRSCLLCEGPAQAAPPPQVPGKGRRGGAGGGAGPAGGVGGRLPCSPRGVGPARPGEGTAQGRGGGLGRGGGTHTHPPHRCPATSGEGLGSPGDCRAPSGSPGPGQSRAPPGWSRWPPLRYLGKGPGCLRLSEGTDAHGNLKNRARPDLRLLR